jgi:hypothetical protein
MTTIKFTIPVHAFVDVTLELDDCTEDDAVEFAEMAVEDGIIGVECSGNTLRILDYIRGSSIRGSVRLQETPDEHDPPDWDVEGAIEDIAG